MSIWSGAAGSTTWTSAPSDTTRPLTRDKGSRQMHLIANKLSLNLLDWPCHAMMICAEPALPATS